MSRAMAVRALLVWLTILVLAVANGALREALLTHGWDAARASCSAESFFLPWC
jgi:hypothetical protein